MSKGFDELTKFHSLSLMKWDEDNYASENTQLAKDFYEAGQQAWQAEIDLLHKRIDGALEKCCIGIRKQGGDYYLELVEGILKGGYQIIIQGFDIQNWIAHTF